MSQDTWVPLSVRTGVRPPFEPVEGVPSFLWNYLRNWVKDAIRDDAQTGIDIDLVLRLNVQRFIDDYRYPTVGDVVAAALEIPLHDQDALLDVIDWLLHRGLGSAGTLERLLATAGHVLRVSPDGDGLVQRLDPSAWALYQHATSPQDAASEHMREAWTLTFGQHPKPGQGWGEAVKAVECLLKPLVSPRDSKATLGKMTAAVRDGHGKWTCALPSRDLKIDGHQVVKTGLDLLTDCLATIGYQPGRHGGDDTGQVEQVTAESMVLLATTVLGWLREGALALADATARGQLTQQTHQVGTSASHGQPGGRGPR